MNNNWKEHKITMREDSSFVITYNGMPYHVPNNSEYTNLYIQVKEWVDSHPEQVQKENITEVDQEELLANTKLLKLNEFDYEMKIIDEKLTRCLSDIIAFQLDQGNTEEYFKSKQKFNDLRSLQEKNRSLRSSVVNTTTIEEVKNISPEKIK